MSRKTTLIHLVSHPVQYYTPMYERIAADTDMDFRVLYCSKKGLEKSLDVEFGVAVQWDVPLLDNYRYKFLTNHAYRESLDSFFGLLNLGILREMANAPKGSVVWIHGWNYATHLLALFSAKFYGHRVFMRGDNAAMIEKQKPNSFKKAFKRLWLGWFIFPFIDTFLAVGKQNKDFFKLMGAPERKIAFAPHAIDNQRFMRMRDQQNLDKKALRQSLGIPLSKKVIIASGKYIDIKRPLDLLRALTLLPNKENVFIIFVGEGELRGDMEQFIIDNQLTNNVLLTGFVNQSQMPLYYAASDIYAMCSRSETWGLSTNEAMCFGLPIVLSDMVGSAADLVDGNGYVYPCGDCEKLAFYLTKLMDLPRADLADLGQKSLDIIQDYSYDNVLTAIKNAVRKPVARKPSYTYLYSFIPFLAHFMLLY
jgi:glycosyltransferase involved in cell wall biosynthesis